MAKKVIAVSDKEGKAVCVGDLVLVFYSFPNTTKTKSGKVSRLISGKGIKIKGQPEIFTKFYKLAGK